MVSMHTLRMALVDKYKGLYNYMEQLQSARIEVGEVIKFDF